MTPLPSSPGIVTTITVDTTLIDQPQVGALVSYTVTVRNTGNVTLGNVEVTDRLGVLTEVVVTLAPGEERSFTYTYALTRDDILAGEIVNQSFAEGRTASSETVPDTSLEVRTELRIGLIEQIREPLTQILEDDLRETTAKQSRLFEDIARGARDRLARKSTDQCVGELNDFVTNNPILFETARAELKPESGPVLDQVANILAQCETGRIEIGGHTDSRGSDAYNISLSQARVDSVLNALKERGVNVERLAARGYGERRPIADNATIEGMARNRRVVFTNLEVTEDVAEECGTVTPFDVDGGADGGVDGFSTDGQFGSESYNCSTGVRQIIRGDFGLSYDEDFGTQAMLSATIQREKMITEDHLRGYFLGGYMSRTAISGPADGEIDGLGVYGGLYGARRFMDNLFLDYYLAGSLGRHKFDLLFADTVPDDISADGTYNYWGLFGGLAVSGDTELGGFMVTPRAGLHLSYASAWDANVTARIPGRSESGRLSIEDQKGVRVFAELGFSFGDTGDSKENLIYTRLLNMAPRFYCDTPFDSDNDTVCGIGIAAEYLVTDTLEGDAWGINFDAETSGELSRISLGVFYERQLFRGNGTLRFGTYVSQDGEAGVQVSVDVRF